MRRPARAWLAALLLLSAACQDQPTPGAIIPSPSPVTPPQLLGADISALERIEQAGGVFRDAGQAGDAITILRAHGARVFRLRLFVNPDYSEVQVNDLAYTVRLASRIKASGAQLMLDIHYSDTWADPGHQDVPAAWAALPFDSLEMRVESYTAGVMDTLKQAGALPDIVQIGNEIDAGMLWPHGRVGGAGYETPAHWDRLTRLLKAAIRGAHGNLLPSERPRIMLHYSQGASTGGTQWFFDNLAGYGVDYDMIGLSYYPWWHGTLAQLQANLSATASRYNKDVMIVEVSYPWRSGNWEGMVTNQAAMVWPATPQGQADMLEDVIHAVALVPNNRGAGVVWWYPEAVLVPGLFIWGGGSLALFDANGNVLPAAAF